MTSADVRTPRLPAHLLYWGRLSADTATAAPAAQQYRLEGVLPIPVDTLHTARAALPDGRLVMVGIEPERLRSHLAERGDVTPATWELVPDHLPSHIAHALSPAECDAVIARLNLLHGQFEPEPRRVLRRRVSWLIQGGLLVAAILMVIGVERRAGVMQAHVDQVTAETRSLLTGVVPLKAGDRHPELQLTMELRRLEQAAAGATTTGMDPVATLAALWEVWPADLRTQVDAISALPDRLVVRGSVPTLADAERLAQACRALETAQHLRVQPLQAQVSDRGAAFLLTMLHQESP